jgi:hypothetical protein
MSNKLLSQNFDLASCFKNSCLIAIKRQICIHDLNIDDFEQMADGPIEFTLIDGKVINFFSIPEVDSVGIEEGCMNLYGDSYILQDLSNNEFWKSRTNQKIISATILQSKYFSPSNPSEFGLEFELENGKYFYIEYLNEDNFFETLRVLDKYHSPPCIKKSVF